VRNVVFIFIVALFTGCFGKDAEHELNDKKGLREDVKILKGIITDMHAGAYAYNTPQELNNVFDSIENSITEDLILRDFYKKIDFIIDRLRCIHTAAYFPADFYDSISNKALFFPIPLIALDNKLYVNSNNSYIPLGAEVSYINDESAGYIIDKLKKYEHTDGYSDVVRSNAIDSYFAYNFYLEYGGFKKFKIQYLSDSSEKFITEMFIADKLTNINTDDAYIPYNAISKEVKYDMEILHESKTALFEIRSFHIVSDKEKAAFNHFLENSFALIKQSGIKNVIIDCRENGGGYYDMTYSFLSYLVDKKLPEYDSAFQRFKHLTYKNYIAIEDTVNITEQDTAYLSYNKIANNLYKLKQEEITEWVPNENLFRGNLYVIVNSRVASAGSTFAAILQDKTNAVILGEETGGSNNEHNAGLLRFELPTSKLKIDIPLRRYYQPIIKKQKDRGVIPNKIFNYTQRDLINGLDKPLSYILDSIIKA
jgi:hypothetical protein